MNKVVELKFSNLENIDVFKNLKVLNMAGAGGHEVSELPALPPSLKTLICANRPLENLPPLPPTLEILDCSNSRPTGTAATIAIDFGYTRLFTQHIDTASGFTPDFGYTRLFTQHIDTAPPIAPNLGYPQLFTQHIDTTPPIAPNLGYPQLLE